MALVNWIAGINWDTAMIFYGLSAIILLKFVMIYKTV